MYPTAKWVNSRERSIYAPPRFCYTPLKMNSRVPRFPLLFVVVALVLTGCKTSTSPTPGDPSPASPVVATPPAPPAVTGRLDIAACPSPNFSERTRPVSMIVLHYTASETASALAALRDAHADDPVSAHYLVDRNGRIYRLVDESKRAWHAGPGVWEGCDDVNSASVGIEIVNLGRDARGRREPYPDAQIEAVIRLCRDIQSRHAIRWVIGHSDMGLGRKEDPGEHFPWKRLAQRGVGIWTDAFAKPTLTRREMLAKIGYDATQPDLATAAFQRHFYPEALTSGGKRTNERMAAVLDAVSARHAKSRQDSDKNHATP